MDLKKNLYSRLCMSMGYIRKICSTLIHVHAPYPRTGIVLGYKLKIKHVALCE